MRDQAPQKTTHRKDTKFAPHSTNKLYDDTMVNILGIDNPELNLNGSNKIKTESIIALSTNQGAYQCSISSMTCTCPDFVETRAIFPKTDPRRGCKHLVELFFKHDLDKVQNSLALEILLSPTRGELCTFKTEKGMVFTLSFETDGWVSVFIPARKKGDRKFNFTGKYKTYGFNLIDARWSYGDAAPGAKHLKNAIYQVFELLKSQKD